jgi:ABC-type sugar transport system ATPase subunit
MLELKKICVKAGDFSLRDVSFSVNKGEYFILLGESGAGKSMVLETIAGLVQPVSGEVFLEGKDVTREKIQMRGMGLVFQDYAIFPHMTIQENIAYALHGHRFSHGEKRKMVREIADQLNISLLLGRRPSTLSGGELQRVALARTLIQKPSVLLLDEPLASLDSRIKSELRSLLRKIHRQGQAILHVTHDYEEALSLGNRIAVIDNGTILQSGTPEEVFRNPRSEFIAHFVGLRNFFKAKILREDRSTRALIDESFSLNIVTSEEAVEGFVLFRGEDIILSNEPFDSSATNNFEGIIGEISPTVNGVDVIVDAGIRFHALVTPGSASHLGLAEGKKTWLHFKATAVKFIPA